MIACESDCESECVCSWWLADIVRHLVLSAGGAQTPATTPAPTIRTCLASEYILTAGCNGQKLVAQQCFASTSEMSQCKQQMGSTVDYIITRDFCYKSIDKHCVALQNTMQEIKIHKKKYFDMMSEEDKQNVAIEIK